MKQVCFFVLFIVIGFCLNGQCPTGNSFNFESFLYQADVDSFLIKYPNCRDLLGGVKISGRVENLKGLKNIITIAGELHIHNTNKIQSLEGLENLTSIGTYLSIYDNTVLRNLNGLENLTSVGEYLSISENPELISLKGLESLESTGNSFLIKGADALTSLKGLENLKSVGTEFGINTNNALTSLEGLENLVSIGTYAAIDDNASLASLKGLEKLTSIGKFLYIENNPTLTSFEGLENLTSIGQNLIITENSALVSLEGLENLEIAEELYIHNNSNLTFCGTRAICNFLLQNVNNATIYDNKIRCNSPDEVLNLCGKIGKVNYTIFYDQNQNGVQESNELIVPNIPIKIEQTGETLISISTDIGRHFLFFGNYTISFIDNPDWELTTLAEQNFEVTDNTPVANISFGIFPKNIFSKNKNKRWVARRNTDSKYGEYLL